MSEGRQLVLLLAAALVLAVVGVVAATVFPEPCEEIEGVGSLELAFEDAAAVLPVDDGDAAAIEGLGAALGIGEWRGAVALPAGSEVVPNDFGFFAVTDTDLVALRPGSGVASAPRDVTGFDVVPVGTTSVGLVAEDGTTAVISSDYERERCGQLPPDADVVAIDRGLAVLRTDEGAAVRTLSGDEVADVPLDSRVLDGVIVERQVGLVTGDGPVTLSIDEPSPTSAEEPTAVADVLATGGDRVLLVADGRPGTLTDLSVSADGDVATRTVTASGEVLDAAPTPAGAVLLTTTGLETDRGATAEVPGSVTPRAVLASDDGQVGLLVGDPAGDGDVLLVWGRDIAA